MQTSLRYSQTARLPYGLPWSLMAVLFGIIAVSQPVAVSLALVLGIGLAVLIVINPIAAFSLMLILAPLRTLFETESPLRLPLDIGQIVFVVALLALFIQRVATGQRVLTITRSAVFVPVGLFFVVASLTAFSAFSLSAWLSEWLKWAVILTLIALVLHLRHLSWLVFALVMAGLANALIGLYIFLGGSGALHLLINDRFFRAFGTFGQPNPFGGFMGLLAPLAFGAALGYTARALTTRRLTGHLDIAAACIAAFYYTAFAALGLGVIISWSRGAWLGFAVAMIALLAAVPRRWWHSLVALLVILSVGGLLWFSGRLPTAIVERVNSATAELFTPTEVRGVDITPENYAVVERLAHWQAALSMAQQHPWLGVGMGNYEVAYPQHRLINWVEPLGHAHNYYLNVFAEAGIIGLTIYIVLWLSILWLTWRARRHPDALARFFAVGLVGTWMYLTIHSLTDNLFVNNMFLHIGVMLGILAVLHYQTTSRVRVVHYGPKHHQHG